MVRAEAGQKIPAGLGRQTFGSVVGKTVKETKKFAETTVRKQEKTKGGFGKKK